MSFKLASLKITSAIIFLAKSSFLVLIFTWVCLVFAESIMRGFHSGLTGDAHIFMTVGRGILNGLVPYKDLFETKPPGIFLIYALSLHWFNGVDLLRLLMLIINICLPLLLLWLSLSSSAKQPLKHRLFFALTSICFGIMVSLRIMPLWDGYQLLANFILFLYTILLVSTNNYWMRVIVGMGALFAITLLREPLIFVYIAISLLIIPNVREGMSQVMHSACLAFCLWCVFMVMTGYLSPYLHIYLPNILTFRGGGLGNLFLESLQIWLFFSELERFSLPFSVAFIFLFLSLTHTLLLRQRTFCARVQFLIRLIIGLYITMFAVKFGENNGGIYSVNCVPVFTAIIVLWLQEVGSAPMGIHLPWHVRCTIYSAILAAVLFPSSTFPPPTTTSKGYQWQIAEAAQLDRILDRCDEDRYFYLGSMQAVIALTRHSPLGPLFFEDNLLLKDDYLAAGILPNVQRANIILVDTEHKLPRYVYSREVENELLKNFTPVSWPCASEAFVNPQGYRLLFRKKDECSI